MSTTTSHGQNTLPPERELLGRSRELSRVEALLDPRAQLPRALLIEGEPGIGKTTLWSSGVDAARERGYKILRARPVEVESQLPFAAFGDLLADSFAEIAPSVPDPQRRALAAALLIDERSESAFDQRTIGVAMLSVLRLMSQSQSVLVAIDDEQWVDRSSASALGFALRRLRSEPIAVLLARRSGRQPDSLLATLDTRLPTERVNLGPVSIGALHGIVVEHIGTVLARPQLRRLHELSQGNPFLALELVRAAHDGRLRLDTAEPASADLGSLLGTRLDALPTSTRTALMAVAAASGPTFEILAAVVPGDPAKLLRPAVDAGILLEPDEGDIRFSHPLFASAAYGTAHLAARRRVHTALAAVVDDPGERARHVALAAVAPDESVASELERTAEQVFRRGAPGAAAELAELAVRLTPADEMHGRIRRTAAQAEYVFEAGDPAAAGALLDGVIAATRAGRPRAAILALRARIMHFGDDVEAAIELDRQALSEAGDDHRLRAGIHEGLAWGLFLTRSDLASAARHARSAVQAARRAGDEVTLAEGLAIQAITSNAIGVRAPRAIEQAMALEPALLDLRVLRHPSYARGYLLACSDELDAARSVFDELLARAADRGDESAIPPLMIQLATIEILAGNWDMAEEHTRTGHGLAVQVGQRPSQAALLSRAALLAAMRGRLDDAVGRANEAVVLACGTDDVEVAPRLAPTRGGELAVWALGAAANAAGSHELAHRYLGPLAERLLGAGMREPGELRFLPDASEALLGLGRLDDADVLVATMEKHAARARRAPSLGIASRCRALVAAGRNDNEAALNAAQRAVALLEPASLPLELARARLVLGIMERRHRQRRAARETLTVAIATFDRLGASGWAARARAEEARIGGRTASAGALTATETRVAELVGQGLANKEVAHVLGIAQKTVELHLSHIYAKLDVRSRTELVRHLAAPSSSTERVKPQGLPQ